MFQIAGQTLALRRDRDDCSSQCNGTPARSPAPALGSRTRPRHSCSHPGMTGGLAVGVRDRRCRPARMLAVLSVRLRGARRSAIVATYGEWHDQAAVCDHPQAHSRYLENHSMNRVVPKSDPSTHGDVFYRALNEGIVSRTGYPVKAWQSLIGKGCTRPRDEDNAGMIGRNPVSGELLRDACSSQGLRNQSAISPLFPPS